MTFYLKLTKTPVSFLTIFFLNIEKQQNQTSKKNIVNISKDFTGEMPIYLTDSVCCNTAFLHYLG